MGLWSDDDLPGVTPKGNAWEPTVHFAGGAVFGRHGTSTGEIVQIPGPILSLKSYEIG